MWVCVLCPGAIRGVVGGNYQLSEQVVKTADFWRRVCVRKTLLKDTHITPDGAQVYPRLGTSHTLKQFININGLWTGDYGPLTHTAASAQDQERGTADRSAHARRRLRLRRDGAAGGGAAGGDADANANANAVPRALCPVPVHHAAGGRARARVDAADVAALGLAPSTRRQTRQRSCDTSGSTSGCYAR